jgi:hypothetical protein
MPSPRLRHPMNAFVKTSAFEEEEFLDENAIT